jgi:hypothetical protein
MDFIYAPLNRFDVYSSAARVYKQYNVAFLLTKHRFESSLVTVRLR